MITKTNDINFKGRYVLLGCCEDVNKAIKTIRLNKGDAVDFLAASGINNKYVIVATNDDSLLLKSKKGEEGFLQTVRQMTKEGKTFLSSLFKYIFGTDENALILQGEHLKRFTYNLPYNNYDTGATKYKKSQEVFVDGTCKKYSSIGRLYSIRKPDGTEISIPLSKNKKTAEAIETQTQTIATTPNQATISKIPELSSLRIKPNENFTPYKDGIMRLADENGKTRAFTFPNGVRKNFDNDENLTDIIYPDGRIELFNEKGRMYLTLYPDGRKEYARRTLSANA